MSQRNTRKNSATTSSPYSPATNTDMRSFIEKSNKEVLLSINSLKAEFDSFRQCLSSVETRIVSIENSLSSYRENQKKCEADIRNLKGAIENLKLSSSEALIDVMHEIEQREERRNNLVIFGLPELTDGSLHERKHHDYEKLQELLHEIHLPSHPVVTKYRVGKVTAGKCRPLKITLPDKSSKTAMLKNAKELRHSSIFRSVFIANDLTKQQQEEMAITRGELQRRRENGEDVVIFKGQIRSKDSLQNFRREF